MISGRIYVPSKFIDKASKYYWSITTSDEIIRVKITFSTNVNRKEVSCEIENFYILLAFFLTTIDGC